MRLQFKNLCLEQFVLKKKMFVNVFAESFEWLSPEHSAVVMYLVAAINTKKLPCIIGNVQLGAKY